MKATTSIPPKNTTQNTETNAMKSTRKTKSAPAATRKSTRILTGSVAALLTVVAVSSAPAATLIRVDFGTSGGPGGYGGMPATGYVETKAAATDASFGSLGANSWVSLDEAGGSLIGTNMLNTDGSATTVDLSITGISNSSASAGDWRGNNANNNLWALSYDGIAGTASNNFTLSGLLPNTETKLWLYSIDRSMQTSGLTITGSTLTTGGQFDQNGNAGGWSTFIRTDANWNHSGGTPNWTADANQSVLNPNNGFGWMLTVTSDGSGTITGSTAFGGGENQTFSGLQIFQADPTLIWNAGADGNWSAATWTGSPPNFPDATRSARIDTGHTVTVDGARAAQNLTTLNQGKILISAGNSLTLSGAISAAAVASGSAVTMAGNTTLSAASGSIASLSAGGNVTLNVTGAGQTVTVPTYTVTAPSALTKGGAGELTITGSGGAAPLGTTTAINLNGGTLTFSRAGFTQALIPTISGVNTWFAAESLGLGNGAAVAAWNDLSGAGHNAAQGSAGNQPTFSTATGPNGLPVVQFRNNDDFMPATGNLFAKEHWAVFRSETANWSNYFTIYGNAGGDDRSSSYLFENGSQGGFHGNQNPDNVWKNGTQNNFNVGPNIDQYMIMRLDVNNNNTNPHQYGLNMQGGWRGNFDLAEYITFDHVLNATEANTVGGYLSARYGITSSYSPYGGYTGIGNSLGESGNINMPTTPVTVTVDSTLNVVTDGTATFGALTLNSGVVTVQGSPGGFTFGGTTVAAAATGGVTGVVPVNIGALTIQNGGTFVGSGPITSSGITLTGVDGGLSTNGTFSVSNYNDLGNAKTLRFGGTGTIAINNTGNTFVAGATTIRVNGATVDATNSGANDPLGGSTSIQLAGGKLSMRGITALNPGSVTYDFESGNLDGWSNVVFSGPGTHDAFINGHQPVNDAEARVGNWGVNTWRQANPGGNSDAYTGIMETGSFTVNAGNHITFKIASAPYAFSGDPDSPNANMTAVTLEREVAPGNWEMVLTENHGTDWNLEDVDWDTTAYIGNTLRLRVYDTSDQGWGHIAVDNFNLSNINAVQVGPINMPAKNFSVDASSELNAQSASTATFGTLTLNNGVLTVSGNTQTTFSVTTVAAAATQVGVSFGSSLTLNSGPIFGSNFTGTFVKAGTGNFVLNAANNGLTNATFDVQAGKLTALSAAGLGGSTSAKLSGGQLFLSSNGGDQAYDISMDVTEDSTLTVGKDTVGGVNAPVNVTLGSAAKTLTVRNGKTLTVNATDSYTLDLNNSLAFEDNSTMTISGAGVNVNILGATTLSMNNGSTLNLNAGTMHTNHAVTVHNLNLNGGVLSLEGAGANKSLHVNGTLTVNNGATNLDLTAGALLTTAGNATINLVNGTITTDSALNVGNLTVEAGGTLNRVGALPADRNVSVGDKLRLVNKNFSTVGSALSVGNRIELDNSTLAFDNNLSLNSVWMNSNSQFNPGAGTTTTINDVIEVYNGSTANFTGATLALGNRFRMEGNGARLTVRNNLNTNGTNEIYQGALVDLGTFNLSTNFQNLHIAHTNSELRATSSSTLDINFLQVWEGGKLNVPSVRIRDYVWLGTRTVNAFNITEENPGKRLEAHQGGFDNYSTNSHVYLTGTNTYTGETQMHDATVLVAQQGVGLPNASMVRFQNGILGTSGTFAREIGDGVDGGGLGRVRFSSWGGFAAFGGPLTVSLITANPGNRIDWDSNDNGFNGQGFRLGAAFDTHDVTITNPININQGIHIEARSIEHLGILAGDLTGNGDFNKNEGKGTIALTGDNSGYTGNIHIRRGALDVGTNGVGLGGTNVVYLRHDTGDPWNWNASVIQANGTLNKNIGQSAGEFYWDEQGGGFAARGGNLSVTLEGGADIDWSNQNDGFNNRQLMFGSTTADSVVTLTNNLNAQNERRLITVIGNPNSASDKAVLSGTLTNFKGLELHGSGTLEIPHDFTTAPDDQIYTHETSTLRVLGNLRVGNLDTNPDPRYVPSGAFNNLEVNSGNLYVSGNVQANYFYSGGASTSQVDILGNVALRHRWIHDRGTAHVVGNVTMGEEHFNVRDGGTMIIDGTARIGAPSGNSADRNVYAESGGAITFNGPLQAAYLQSNGQNGTRSSSIRINGTAMIGNNGGGNIHFNGENMSLGGVLDGSGTITANYIEFHNMARLAGTLTVNVNDRIEFHGSNSILAPGNSAGTLTIGGNLQLNGGSHYYFDAGDMVNFTSGTLTANDGWTLDFKTGGSTFATGGSIELFHYTNLGSFDDTPNYNVADLIAAGWIPNNFDTGTLSITASGGVVTLFGLQRQPIIWTGASSGPGDNNWSTGANWATPVSAANVLTFAGNVRLTPNNDFAALTSFAGLDFNGTAGAFTVGGNAIDLTGSITNSSANAQVINLPIQLANAVSVNTGGQNMTLGGNLSGTGGLTKTGGGTLTLGGTNTQTGTTTIQQGVVAVGSASALGTTITSLKFTGGTLRTTAAITSDRPVEVATGGGTVDTNGFTSTLSGALSGTGSLTKDGAGTLNLTGTSTNTAAMNVNGGTLRGNTDSLKGNVVLANTSNVAFNQTANGTYAKQVSGAGNLTKEGAGVMTLANNNTYNGATVISGGTLKLQGITYTQGLRGSIFTGTPGNDTPMNLDGAAYVHSQTRIFTGTQAGTVLALTSLAGHDVVINQQINDWNGFPNSGYGDDFVTAFSGVFTPAESGAHNFHWDNDDRGLMYIDLGGDGVFHAGDKIGSYDWNSNGTVSLTAGTHYSVIYMAQEFGGGENVNWMFTTPSLSERRVNPAEVAQAGMWSYLGAGGGDNVLPVTTAVSMASNTTLDLNAVNQQVASLADLGGGSGREVLLAGAKLTIGAASGPETTFTGDISSTFGDGSEVEKVDATVQNLNGAQEYDTLTVSGGTLNVNGEVGTTPANGTASVAVTGAGTSLKFGSVSQTLSSLTIGAGSTVTFTSGAASGGFSGGGKGASLGASAAVPEPGTLGLLLVGALGVLNRRRRKA